MTRTAAKILLLDDDADEFVLLKRILARAANPYTVDWTADAEEALADVRRGGHDVYLIDYQIAGVTGTEVIREAVRGGAKAPLILLTGRTSIDGKEQGIDIEALRVGAADYLSKQGLTPEGLDRTIRYARERMDAALLRERLGHAEEEGSRLQAAMEKLQRLQAMTAALAEALSPAEVGEAAMEHGLAALGAFAGAMYVPTDDGEKLRRLAGKRLSPLALRFEVVPMTLDVPLTAAVRDRRPLFFSTRDEIIAAFPAMESEGLGIAVQAAAVLPLLSDGQVKGAISLTFTQPTPFSRDDREYAGAIAQQCAQAIHRAALREAERRVRERASFLAEASALLASSLDDERVLGNLAKLIVPRLADWCSIEMVEGDTTRELAVAHARPEKVEWARALRQKYPSDRSQPRGIHHVIRTGTPEIYPEISDELLRQAASDEEHLELLRTVGMKSALVVPLIASGKTLGGITLVWAESGHRYDEEALELMMEIAHRAALAVENARLYRDAHLAVEVRDEFLSVAGHELKTPLAALLMHIQSLQRSVGSNDSAPRLGERLAKAAGAGRRLEKLIYELLDVSRITAGRFRLEPEPFQLDDLLREVVDRFNGEAARAQTRIALSASPVPGCWDRSRLDQVVTNLLANALKYGKGKPIEVEVFAAGDDAILRVIDHGIGIETDQQRRIFERFERAVATREYGGFGLGLWIVRQIVEASGGRIELESRPGEGSTFTVVLPRCLTEEAHAFH
jgi:signal transduction histidine kinase/DNA-binding response OmpR family regulator